MGCDIHLYVEIRKNGKWERAGQLVKNPYYYPDEDGPENTKLVHEDFWKGRNYQLFGVLAQGVRRDMDSSFKIKGLPKDITKEVKEIADYMGVDGHSHSWLNLAELFDYAYKGDYGKKDKNRFEEIDSYFAEVTFPKLIALAAEPGMKPEDVRIVFFFDN
jgi:hypothetical protein